MSIINNNLHKFTSNSLILKEWFLTCNNPELHPLIRLHKTNITLTTICTMGWLMAMKTQKHILQHQVGTTQHSLKEISTNKNLLQIASHTIQQVWDITKEEIFQAVIKQLTGLHQIFSFQVLNKNNRCTLISTLGHSQMRVTISNTTRITVKRNIHQTIYSIKIYRYQNTK